MSKQYSDEYILEWYKERCAIREYLGNEKRERAEYLAARDVRAEFRRVPQCVLDLATR